MTTLIPEMNVGAIASIATIFARFCHPPTKPATLFAVSFTHVANSFTFAIISGSFCTASARKFPNFCPSSSMNGPCCTIASLRWSKAFVIGPIELPMNLFFNPVKAFCIRLNADPYSSDALACSLVIIMPRLLASSPIICNPALPIFIAFIIFGPAVFPNS